MGQLSTNWMFSRHTVSKMRSGMSSKKDGSPQRHREAETREVAPWDLDRRFAFTWINVCRLRSQSSVDTEARSARRRTEEKMNSERRPAMCPRDLPLLPVSASLR